MGKTIRNTADKWLRRPKSNGARKGEVRPKALPPNSYDDLDVSGNFEDWALHHNDADVMDQNLKKRIKKLKREGRKMRGKDKYRNLNE